MKRIFIFLLIASIIGAVGTGGYFALRLPRNQILVPISVEEMARLQEQGESAAPHIPRLIECFDRDNEDLRLQASLTLGTMRQGSRSLAQKLTDPNPKTRFAPSNHSPGLGPMRPRHPPIWLFA